MKIPYSRHPWPQKSTTTGNPNSTEQDKKRDWNEKCLNEKCDGTHRIRDCPLTGKDKAAELLKTHYEKNKKVQIKDQCYEKKGIYWRRTWHACIENV